MAELVQNPVAEKPAIDAASAVQTQAPVQEVPADELATARDLQERGIINQLPPLVRARMLKALETPMKKELEESLKPTAELVAAPKNESSFIDQLMAPVRSSIQNPGAAVYNLGRGVERSFNLLPLVNVLTPGQPHIQDDLETFDSLFGFPVIRGAELAARMFVPEDRRPSLTTFAQVVQNQKSLDKEMRQLTPGVQEGSELGSVLAGVVPLLNTGLKIGQNIARGIPNVAKGVQEWRAGRAMTKARNLNEKLLDLPMEVRDGPIAKAILERPDEVRNAMNKSGTDVNDIALQLKTELQDIGENLGKKVAPFRDAAYADETTRLEVPKELGPLLQQLRSRTTLDGVSQLPAKENAALRSAEKMVALGVTTPNQAMVLNDSLQNIIGLAYKKDDASNHVKSAMFTLIETKRIVKSLLRQTNSFGLEEGAKLERSTRVGNLNPEQIRRRTSELAFQAWSDADTDYSGFLTYANGVEKILDNAFTAESKISNLFGKHRTELQNYIEKALNYAEKLDPTAVGHGKAFLSRLADIKAGDLIKETRIGIDRVKQESANEIVRYWTNFGSKIGMGALGGPATFLAAKTTSDPTISGMIGIGATYTGNMLGGMAGKAVGKVIANPERVLDAASKAKDLSDSARKLSRDMLYLHKVYGPESSIALLDLIGPQPAVNELIKFTNSQRNKEKDNANSKTRK